LKLGRLLWGVPLALAGIAIGAVMLLLGAVACVLYVPSLRSMAIEKGVEVANEQTGMDIDLGGLYLSPFHHSPMVFYRAYKGEADLPLEVKIDSLFVGHRGHDTLACIQTLRLSATMKNEHRKIESISDLLSVPIEVHHLQLDKTTFHSDSLIATVGVDAIVGHLALASPDLNIAEGRYPLHGLRLYDVYCGIDLRSTPPDTTTVKEEPAPLKLAFDVQDGELRNIHFALTPVGLDIATRTLLTDVLVDVGGNTYDARRLMIGGVQLAVGTFSMPVDTLYGGASVELNRNMITSNGLYVRSAEMGVWADLSATRMDLGKMRVEVAGDADFRGSKAQLRGFYDIDDEAYALHAEIEKVDMASFLPDSTRVVIAGEVDAEGRGLDPHSRAMRAQVKMHLADAVYDEIDVSGLHLEAELANRTVAGDLLLPVKMKNGGIKVSAQTEHQFRVTDFMMPERMKADYYAQLRSVRAHVADEDIAVNSLELHFATADTTSLDIATQGLYAEVQTPMHVMHMVDKLSAFSNRLSGFQLQLSDLSPLDTVRSLIPDMAAQIVLTQGSPAQPFIARTGLEIDTVALSLLSDSLRTTVAVDASIPEIGMQPADSSIESTGLRLPAAKAAMRVTMAEGKADASLNADTRLTDGAMSVYGLRTDAALRMELTREQNRVQGDGRLILDSLSYDAMDLGSRAITLRLSPSQDYTDALYAEVQTDEIPLDIVEGLINMKDIAIHGAVKASASVDGLPLKKDISAEVQPIGIRAEYKPYEAGVSLDETPIIMEHNHIDLNGLKVYGADSTFIAFTGGLDLDSMRMDIMIAADSLVPVKLPKDGPLPVYGEFAADIHGSVTGPMDSIVADVNVTILPTTDITYPIDKKNLAQVKPYGTVNVRYEMAEDTLLLGGRINVDDGFIRYSPKAYPVMPFHVDSGSHITFRGPIGQTLLDVSASQKVKASSQSEGEDVRMVDFRTGVRVNGVVDSIGLHSIGFFLEAPEDETITEELAAVDEDTREGLAATLLATGMYMGESNVSAHEEGYALTSIINSRINAAMVNSKRGKVIDIDVSSGTTQRASGDTKDLNIAISKSFFNDRLRLSVGAALSDNPDAYKNVGLINNISAEYKLTKDGMVSLRAFGQRDYNNILEGELIKSGLGVRATKEWRRQEVYKSDSLFRTYGLTADADVAWRSNNSLGPNLTLTHSIKNLLGNGETFTVKANGAYYWALRNRHPGDPKKTDTYKLGVNASLIFPYLHWTGDHNPEGDTRYMMGYQYENIAGGYGVHKLSGSFTYFIRSPRSSYITHAFTPFSLSVVLMKAESYDLLDKTAEFPQLLKVIAGDEFVPSIGYNFIYNNHRSKRAVNTMLDLGVKESGNLINAIYCAFGHKWNEADKHIGSIVFNQFVKLTFELRNKFNLTDQICFATRLFAGANIPTGGVSGTPLSEAFYAGGPNSMRSAAPYAYGPGNFYSSKYNQNFFHAGDVKLEGNFEFRFPIVWKLYGAAFVDAGNVWNWMQSGSLYEAAGITDYRERFELHDDIYDGIINNPHFLEQIALGTGAGLRLDFDGLVIRVDLGVAIHAPYQTYRYDKKTYQPDYNQPIKTYFNLPSALDALRVNFGIGYPF